MFIVKVTCIQVATWHVCCACQLQAEPASSVRKYVADFCAAAAQTRPSSAVLAAAAQGLAGLMYDGEVDVAKQALIAAHVVLKAGLAAHAAQVQGGVRTEQVDPCSSCNTTHLFLLRPASGRQELKQKSSCWVIVLCKLLSLLQSCSAHTIDTATICE